MDKTKQEIIKRVTEKYVQLPEPKQMFILGIMEGMQLARDEEKKTA
jgi:hypothetical protein